MRGKVREGPLSPTAWEFRPLSLCAEIRGHHVCGHLTKGSIANLTLLPIGMQEPRGDRNELTSKVTLHYLLLVMCMDKFMGVCVCVFTYTTDPTA